MGKLELILLQELFDKPDAQMRLSQLEVITGKEGRDLRNALENLKDLGFVLEELDKYFISSTGMAEAKSRWA
ncbi:MAG: hypothetical protein KDK41_04700 [Leptospiraceae bacterium]|nr:hypothetical protein [Leptospiraceae bacterium]MCB1199922.1 hypothetical protein [Leptospiraceae bacterium]